MKGTFKLLRKPGYAVFLAFLCLTLFCLPFISIANLAGRLEAISLYLFLLWLFLILNLFLMSTPPDDRPPSSGDRQGDGT